MNERHIFTEALERDDPAERSSYLDGACGEDAMLRKRVEKLLRSYGNANSFLEIAPDALIATIAGAEFAASDEISLNFLEPTEKAGCLGILGQYEVVEVIGRGGMGVVLRAYDTKLNRVVAIKAIAPELATNKIAVKRFLREARTAAAINHDHVVTLHAIHDSEQLPFLVMEFVEGQSLQDKLEQAGSLDAQEILRIGMQAAAGLAAAHEQGIVHRDIKPANILLENGVERVKITDFGLARAVDDVSVTQPGLITGTPEYMSPEQACGQGIDHRSDLFSLGAVLYTLCTGHPPFRAESSVAMLRAVLEDTPRSIQEINPEIPTWLEELIARLLAKNPDDRFQSARELADCCRDRLATSPDVELQQPDIGTQRFHVFQSKQKAARQLRGIHLLFASLCVTQVLGLAGTVTCMAEEVDAAQPMLPLLSLIGLLVAFDGWRIARSWLAIAFGTSTAILAIYLTLVANELQLPPADADDLVFHVALLVYALVAVPFGLVVFVAVLLEPEDRWPTRLQFTLRNTMFMMAIAGVASLAAQFAMMFQNDALLAVTSWLFVVTVFATSAVILRVVKKLGARGELACPEIWRKQVIIATASLLVACFGAALLYRQGTNYGYVVFQSPVDTIMIERLRNGRVERTYDTLHLGGTSWHVPVGEWQFRVQGDDSGYTLDRGSLKMTRRSRHAIQVIAVEAELAESHHTSPLPTNLRMGTRMLPEVDDVQLTDVTKLFGSALLLMTFDNRTREDREDETIVLDLSSEGNDAIGDEAEFSENGHHGEALKLNGINSLRLSRRVLPPSGPFTVTGWFRHERGHLQQPVYTEFIEPQKSDLQLRIEDDQVTSLRVAFEYPRPSTHEGSRAHPFWESERPADGQWYFAAWSHNPNQREFRCVINERWKLRADESDFPERPVDGTASIGLGFRGMIDELAIFDRALSEHELAVLYRRGHVGLSDE
ncbi:MAG: protein kinase [Planctomycetes bacterium]|nr:protein kinase [Planctomycetota bacterium]